MKAQKSELLTLKELEAEVLAEGREWTRRRLQQRLQAHAEKAGAVFPPAAMPATSADGTDGGGENNPERDLRTRPAKR
jgi:hypothetical protein